MPNCRECGTFVGEFDEICSICYANINPTTRQNRDNTEEVTSEETNATQISNNEESLLDSGIELTKDLASFFGAITLFCFVAYFSPAIFDAFNTLSDDGTPDIAVITKDAISCNNWQEGRYWEINGVSEQDKTCKGRTGSSGKSQMIIIADLEVGDYVRYIIDGQVHCSVTITHAHVDAEEAYCA